MRDKVIIFFRWLKTLKRMLWNDWLRYEHNHKAKIQIAKINGQCLQQMETVKKSAQECCNHRKGGIHDGRYQHGTSHLFSVIKHKHSWGDIWVRCIRCGKNWKPGDPDYDKALNFITDNLQSSSIQFIGKGLKERAREATRDTT